MILIDANLLKALINGTNGNGIASTSSVTLETIPPNPPMSPPIVNFSPEQLASLKCQIMAFKLLSRNQPLPQDIHEAVFSPVEALKLITLQEKSASKSLMEVNTQGNNDGSKLGSNVFDINGGVENKPDGIAEAALAATALVAVNELAKEKALLEEAPLEEVEDPTSLVYPYNSFSTPGNILRTQVTTTKRPLLIPTLLPRGLDPQALADERNKFIEARVQQRINELESLPSNLNQDDHSLPSTSNSNSSFNDKENSASTKLKALIELKSLHLLARQKSLREDVIKGYNQASSLSLPTDRASFRRTKKITLRDARQTEQLEQKQKLERERRAKQKHLDHLTRITIHGRDLVAAHRSHQSKFSKIGKTLLKFHADAEKDEQRRVERVSKERLKALRADDEEGYLKLIDTAKDTRITHLLRQTDAFLESLAAAVVNQQNDAVHDDPSKPPEPIPMQVDSADSAIDESRFGAAPVFAEEQVQGKVDYYNVSHRIKETITEQPKMLIGGQLKAYQIKGLEWMVSLYNNKVNGILADEMVSLFLFLLLRFSRFNILCVVVWSNKCTKKYFCDYRDSVKLFKQFHSSPS